MVVNTKNQIQTGLNYKGKYKIGKLLGKSLGKTLAAV